MEQDLFRLDLDDLKYENVEQFLRIAESEDRRPKEGDLLDFKADMPAELGDLVTAFSNTYGGLIILGIEASKGKQNVPVQIQGILGKPDNKSAVINTILSTVYPRPSFSVGVAVLPHKPERVIIVIRVEESRIPPHMFIQNTRNKISIRIGDENRYASLQQIEALFKKRAELASEGAAIRQLLPLDVVAESSKSTTMQHHKVALVPGNDLNIRLDRVYERKFEKMVKDRFPGQNRYINNALRHARYHQIEMHREEGVYYHRAWRLYSSGAVEFVSQVGKGNPKLEHLGDLIADVIAILRVYKTLLQEKGYFGRNYFRHELSIVQGTKFVPEMSFSFGPNDKTYDKMDGVRLDKDTIDVDTPTHQHVIDRYLDFSEILAPNELIAENFLEHLRMIFQASITFDNLLENVIWIAREPTGT